MSNCLQEIDCCPPDPWTYLIHEQLVTVQNAQQCATLGCPDGQTFTACVAAGTFSLTGDISTQSAMQALVDQQALTQAQANAKTLLGNTCFGNQQQCQVIYCNPDGTLRFEYFLGDDDWTCAGRVFGAGVKAAAWIPAGGTYADTQAAADAAIQAAYESLAESRLTCPVTNSIAYWALADCITELVIGDCLTSDPGTPPAGQAVGNVVVGEVSAANLATANANACALAKQRAIAAATVCHVPATLSGLVWAMPCNPVVTDINNWACQCQDPADISRTVGGKDPGTTYNALLRIRGAVELKKYLSGTAVPGTGYVLNNATPATGTDYKNYNRYSLLVDNPPQNYVLNNAGTHNLQNVYLLDYQFTIQVKTGSIVTLRAESMDQNPVPGQGLQYRADWQNWSPPGRIVPDNDPQYPLNPQITQPGLGYNGQWLQMDCLGLTVAP